MPSKENEMVAIAVLIFAADLASVYVAVRGAFSGRDGMALSGVFGTVLFGVLLGNVVEGL